LANEYLDLEQLKETLSLTGTSNLDDDLRSAIEAASRGVDLACSRRRLRKFWKDGEDVTRYYSPRDGDSVEVNDVVEVTSLRTDADGDGTFETEWSEGTDYVLFPLNAAEDGEPSTIVQVHPLSGLRFPTRWPRSVELTGKFGWPDVPPGVVEATGLIAARLFKRKREAPFAVVGFGIDQSAALHIARTDPDVVGLLKPLSRNRSFVAATLD